MRRKMKSLLDYIDYKEPEEAILSLLDIKTKVEKFPWRQGNFNKQSWRHSLHGLAPYVGKITPAFAHWLIKLFHYHFIHHLAQHRHIQGP